MFLTILSLIACRIKLNIFIAQISFALIDFFNVYEVFETDIKGNIWSLKVFFECENFHNFLI